MGHRQKGKSMKRKRSWHRRGAGPDRAWARAVKRLDAVIRDSEAGNEGEK